MVPSAAEIVEQTAHTYASCATYRDTGEVVTVFIKGERPLERRTDRRPFSTLFVRPDRFRFEFSNATVGPESEWHRYVVWTEGGSVSSWWTVQPALKHSPTILKALAGPTGVSGGSAIRVPRLLLPDGMERLSLPVAASAALDGREVIDGAECFHISGPSGSGGTVDTWIDVDTWLLRRVRRETVHDQALRDQMRERILREPGLSDEQRATFLGHDTGLQADFRTEATTTYAAVINTPIPAEAFGFTPPE